MFLIQVSEILPLCLFGASSSSALEDRERESEREAKGTSEVPRAISSGDVVGVGVRRSGSLSTGSK